MTDGDSEDLEQTRVHFDALRLELAKGTNDWKLPVVVRSYDPGEDGHEDYEDEAMLFEEHGYDRSFVQEEAALTATYRKTTGRVGSPAISEAAFCPKCGAARPDGAAFCPKCGAHYEQPAPAIARSSSKAPWLIAVGVGAVKDAQVWAGGIRGDRRWYEKQAGR